MAATARQKRSYLHHQGEFQHNYFDFVSLHHSDHDGLVRIFVGHSEVVKRLLFTLIRLFRLRGATALLVAALQPLQLAGRATVRYCSSFQLAHMSREDHAQSSIDMSSQQWRPKVRQELITVLTTLPAR